MVPSIFVHKIASTPLYLSVAAQVCFNAIRVRSNVVARMGMEGLLSLDNPEGTPRLHARLPATRHCPCGAP